MQPDRKLCSKRYIGGLLIVSATSIFAVAAASATDLKDLTMSPLDYIGKEVEIAGYCVKGGVNGDVLGYECTTEGGVYVDTDDVEPAAAKQKVDESCKGNGHDAACRATIRFTPHSFTTSTKVEADKTVTIFNADKAKLSF
jgi:hypothetical protein